MTTKIANHVTIEQPVQKAQTPYQNGVASNDALQQRDVGAGLPTFPLDVGWRAVVDHEQEPSRQVPLTLLDLLFPTDDDVGVIFMAQSSCTIYSHSPIQGK